jgi:hypothetical protein
LTEADGVLALTDAVILFEFELLDILDTPISPFFEIEGTWLGKYIPMARMPTLSGGENGMAS